MSTLSGKLPAASAGRKGELKKLGRLVRGELDWIVMKALEKDRARRYETVAGFAADVERYLKGEAVEACPPSATYRMRKFLQKHKGPVIAASLIVLTLVAGTIGTTWGMLRAREQESLTKEQQFLGLVSLAHSQRIGNHAGRQFDTLRTIARAAEFRITPELRNEAAAAVVLSDIELEQEWTDTDPTGELTLSFDGSVIHYARVSQEGAVTIGRVIDGREAPPVVQLPAHAGPMIRGPWWSDDRRFLVYGHSGARAEEAAALRVLRLDGPAPTVVLDDPKGVLLSAFAFHFSGRKCAAAHLQGDVTVYDLETGGSLLLPVGKVIALAFHPRDDRLAVAGGNVLRIFNSSTGLLLKTLPLASLSPDQGIRCIDWHPDGRHIAAGCLDSRIHILDTESGDESRPWQWDVEIGSVAFNHAGDQLLSSDWEGKSALWDVTPAQPLATPKVFSTTSKFSPDDRFAGFSRDQGKIQVWRLASGRGLRLLGRPGGGARERLDLPWLDDTGRVLAGMTPKRLSFFDIVSGEELASVAVPENAVRPFGFDPAGAWFTGGTRGVMLWPHRSEPGRRGSIHVGPPQLLVSGDGRGPVTPESVGVAGLEIWPGLPDEVRVASLRAAAMQPFVSGFGTSLWHYSCASGNGKVLVISDHDGSILIHRDRPGPPLWLGPQTGVRGAEISPDGNWVVTCSSWPDDKTKLLKVWDGEGHLVKNLSVHGDYGWGKFSPDGHWFNTITEAGSQLWEVGHWAQPVATFTASVMFSPDGKLMAISDVVGCVRLLETSSSKAPSFWKEVARVTGPGWIKYIHGFTPDGTRLIACGDAVYVWDLPLIRERLSAMGLAGDWPKFEPAVPAVPVRLSLTIDTGVPAPEVPAATAPTLLWPTK